MHAPIDKAGRLVIPKELRDDVGLLPGTTVDVVIDGAGLRIEPVSGHGFVEKDGFLIIPETGASLSDDDVREMRLADQK